jgi:hypothetical protein
MVRGLVIELESLPVQFEIPDSAATDPEKDALLGGQIDLLLQQGIIEPAFPSDRAFVSHMFLRPKPDGSFRPILNLSGLNEFTIYRHFKMDHLSTVMTLLPQNSYMSSIDITSAYFALPVRLRDRDLLQLQFHGRRYRYTCLPNGYSPGPRVFTRIMKALLAHLRTAYGVNLVFYIDDTLIYGDTLQAVRDAVSHTLRVLQQAGFTISYKKSVLEPARVIEYLGFQIDSATLTLNIPPKKQLKLLDILDKALDYTRMSVRQFSGVLGKLAATCPGNDRAKVLIKPLQRVTQCALIASNRDYESPLYLSPATKECLREWAAHIPMAKAVYAEKLPEALVYTDSSKKGWGSYWVEGDQEYGEEWPIDTQQLHINILELRAILVTLKHLLPHVKQKLVHLFIDNTTAIACIKKGGSTSSFSCNEETEAIFRYAWKKGITFKLSYCPTKLNVRADRASRAFITSGEWTLDRDTADMLFGQFQKPHVDLFASAANHQCDTYVTLNYDANAHATDAFTLKWDMHSLIFPPFSLIGRTLRKLRRDHTKGILVVPMWRTQPWFPQLTQLRGFNKRLTIPVNKTTLRWPHSREKIFPLADRMELAAIPI